MNEERPARHSGLVLTLEHYTHTLIGDERAAMGRLPRIRANEPEPRDGKAVAGGPRRAYNRAGCGTRPGRHGKETG